MSWGRTRLRASRSSTGAPRPRGSSRPPGRWSSGPRRQRRRCPRFAEAATVAPTPALLFDDPPPPEPSAPAAAPLTLVLAHGAGAPMDSPFMTKFAGGIAARGWRVARFEFPYMRARREAGKRGAPDPPGRLLESWREVVAALG